MFSPSYLQTGQGSTAWIWYMLLAVFVLLLIFLWLNRRKDVPLDESPQEMMQTQEEKAADDLKRDNLKRIEGIGPKVEQVLNGEGIRTFEALANARPATLQNALNAAGLRMMNPEGWIEQARLAAKGDWEGLEKLQGELKGGRKK